MDWRDRGLVLVNRGQGENHSILTVFTPHHGKVSALVYGGQGRSKAATLQCGNGVEVTWRGKTADSMGSFSLDLTEPRAAHAFADPKALSAMTATAELLLHTLPEGEGMAGLFEATDILFNTFREPLIWPIVLARWEVGLLSTLGMGLTLDRCVATDRLLEDGAELCFVSPKSGGAVSYQAGRPYQDKLFPLPPFLIGQGEPVEADVRAALRLSGHFIQERLLEPLGRRLPDARQLLGERL